MIYQTTPNDHTENQFFHALKELQIAKLLHSEVSAGKVESIIFLHLIVISLIPVRCPAADFPLGNNFHNCHPTLVFYSKIPVRSHPCFVMLFPPAGIAVFIYFEFRPKLFVFPFQLRNTWR